MDTIANADSYMGLGIRFQKAFKWLLTQDLDSLSSGKHEILPDGELFVLAQKYFPKAAEEVRWEAHRKYIDIHYIHSGEETMAWERLSSCKQGAYDAEKDFLALDAGTGLTIHAFPGDFAVFFPQDAHRPGIMTIPGLEVRKLVFKILAY